MRFQIKTEAPASLLVVPLKQGPYASIGGAAGSPRTITASYRACPPGPSSAPTTLRHAPAGSAEETPA